MLFYFGQRIDGHGRIIGQVALVQHFPFELSADRLLRIFDLRHIQYAQIHILDELLGFFEMRFIL